MLINSAERVRCHKLNSVNVCSVIFKSSIHVRFQSNTVPLQTKVDLFAIVSVMGSFLL